MVGTPEVHPDDTFIRVGPSLQIPSPAHFVVQVLRNEWDPTNTDSVEPNVDLATEHKNIRFHHPADWISIYMSSENNEIATLGYNHENQDINFSIDIFTTRSVEHMERMAYEARRIIMNNRKSTFPCDEEVTGVSWMKWGVRVKPFDTTSKGWYRKTVDCQIRWRFRSI